MICWPILKDVLWPLPSEFPSACERIASHRNEFDRGAGEKREMLGSQLMGARLMACINKGSVSFCCNDI